MADVQPLDAVRYAPGIDLASVVCPPFDTISPREQERLYRLHSLNAVRLELPKGGDPYNAAADTLRRWLADGTLVRDATPAYYVYQQEFRHGGETYRRRVLFGRLRLEPWDRGVVLPHERTFSGPKEDRLNLLRSLRLNTSPIFLVYPDSQRQVVSLIGQAASTSPTLEYSDENGLAHGLWRVDDAHLGAAIAQALEGEKLYVADGHHRYETALAYREERPDGASGRHPADGSENFTLAALASVDDPGLLVLPIHRLVDVDVPLERAIEALTPLFEVEKRPSLTALLGDMRSRGRAANCFGLAAAGSPDLLLLTLTDPQGAARHFPDQCSPILRRLDAAVATHVILHHALGLDDARMEGTRTVWYEESADAAVVEVRQGRARYAVLLNSVSPRQMLDFADAGERMPQKSTFFYPKIPAGLLFNPLFAA